MGRPKLELKKERSTFTLTQDAREKLNKVPGTRQKSKIVSQLIEKYL